MKAPRVQEILFCLVLADKMKKAERMTDYCLCRFSEVVTMGQKTLRPTVKLFLFILLMGWRLLIAPTLVGADGQSRPATKQEKEFYKSVKTTLVKALPANAPAGWDEVDRSVINELTSVGIGEGTTKGPERPFRVDYYVTWRDTKRKQAADEAAQAALSRQFEVQKGQPDGAELDKLNEELEKLADELGKAVNTGDMDKAMKLQTEMEKIAVKMNTSYAGNDAEQNELLKKMAPHDVDAGIYIVANSFFESFYNPVKSEEPVVGGLVYRSEEEFTPERGWREGYTYVFLGGNWKFKQDGGYGLMETAVNQGLSNLTVQTIIVRIQAAPARARELIQKIDWELLKKSIKK